MAHSFLARIFSDMKERIEFFLAGEQVDNGSALGGETCCWAWVIALLPQLELSGKFEGTKTVLLKRIHYTPRNCHIL